MVVRRGKHTKTKQRTKRAHWKLEELGVAKCAHCGVASFPHQVCLNCGYYKGRKVVDVLAKLEKKERKLKEKELEASTAESKQASDLNLKELSKK